MVKCVRIYDPDGRSFWIVSCNQVIKRYTDEKFLSLVCAPHQAEYKTVYCNLKDSFSYKDSQYCANFFLSNLYDKCSVNGRIEAFRVIWDDIIGEHEGRD